MNPKGPCSCIVYTWALKLYGTLLGPKYILYNFMHSSGKSLRTVMTSDRPKAGHQELSMLHSSLQLLCCHREPRKSNTRIMEYNLNHFEDPRIMQGRPSNLGTMDLLGTFDMYKNFPRPSLDSNNYPTCPQCPSTIS